MRLGVQSTILLSVVFAIATAFTVSPSPWVSVETSKLFMSDDALAEQEVAAPTGLSMTQVRNAIRRMSASNFVETLEAIKPFIVHEAGSTFYAKSMKRIASQAKVNGVQVPVGYAKEAAANVKRVSRQNAFIAKKEAQRIAQEEEEAAAAAAAAAEIASTETVES